MPSLPPGNEDAPQSKGAGVMCCPTDEELDGQMLKYNDEMAGR